MKIFILLLVLLACSEEKSISKGALYEYVRSHDEGLELLLAESLEAALASDQCKGYGLGCVTSVRAKLKKLEVIFVEMNSEKDAYREALRIDQYQYKNWVIDQVVGEPALEVFFKEEIKAVRPSLEFKDPS
jgi:hypothetical protein